MTYSAPPPAAVTPTHGRAPSVTGVRLLRAGLAGVVVFGLASVVLPYPDRFFAWLLLGEDRAVATSGVAGDYIGFVFALTGALTLGWSVLLAWVVTGPLAQGVRGAWTAVTASVAVWFVVDSAASVLHGYATNVLPNVLIVAVCFAPGLWLTRPARR